MKNVIHSLFAAACILFAAPALACTGGTQAGSITPTCNAQLISADNGDYFTFTGWAGFTYTFSTCSGNGSSTSWDTQISILDNSGNQLAYVDDYCGLQTLLSFTSSATATYRVLISEYNCNNDGTSSGDFVYWADAWLQGGSSQFPSSTHVASNSPSNDTITTCAFAGDYSVISLTGGVEYTFHSSNANDYLVLTNTSNTVIDYGSTPLTFQPASGQSVRLHVWADSCMNPNFSCRATYISRAACIASSQYPSGLDTANQNPIPLEIDDCNWGGEYFEVFLYSGESYIFNSSDPGDYVFFTDTFNNYFFGGQVPLQGNVTGGDLVLRAHLFSDSLCGEEQVCRTTTVTCITCDMPMPTVSADTNEICAGDSVILTATDTLATTYWYAGSCGGTPIDSGHTTTVYPTTNTWYYASNQYNNEVSECDSVEIAVYQNPDLSFSQVENVLCNGDSSGSALAIGSGGTNPYDYSWSNGTTIALDPSLSAGDYTVTLTDAKNCIDIDTVSITEPILLVSNFSTINHVLCNNESNGSMEVTSSGGIPPYNFNWSNGNIGSINDSLSAGSYSVTVTDSNGCINVLSDTIIEPSVISLLLTATNANCETDANGSIDSDVNGGVSPYSYDWSTSSNATSITDLSVGTYTLTIEDDNGCVFMDSATIGFDHENPTVLLDSSAYVCEGFEIELDAGNTGASFAWSTGETTQTIMVSSAGTYTVEVTDMNDCSSSASIIVDEEECVGIESVISKAEISTFPNPTTGILNVSITFLKSPSPVRIELRSLNGTLIESRKASPKNNSANESFDLSNLSKGIYMMQFSIDDKSVTKRIIVQ